MNEWGAPDRIQVGKGGGVSAGGVSSGGHRSRLPRQRHCKTGKRRLSTQMEALQQLARNRRKGRGERAYYQCECGWWHLTSQGPSTGEAREPGMAWVVTPSLSDDVVERLSAPDG